MININLVIKQKPKVNWRRVTTVTLGILVLGAYVGYAAYWIFTYRLVQREKAALAGLERSYREAIARAGKLKEQEAELKKQEDRLAQMGRNQAPGGQAAVLSAVLSAAREVGVTEVAFQKEGEVLISGQAPSFQAAMAFLSRLRELPELAAVEERKLTSNAAGQTTFTFAARAGGR
jgi:hypothetical protein